MEEKDLTKMTVTKLKEEAKKYTSIQGVSAMKKEELLDLIREHWGIEDEGLTKKEKKKAGRPAANVKDLKLKIRELRGQKESAREAKDRRKVDIIRRRINRLKKQTRKAAQA